MLCLCFSVCTFSFSDSSRRLEARTILRSHSSTICRRRSSSSSSKPKLFPCATSASYLAKSYGTTSHACCLYRACDKTTMQCGWQTWRACKDTLAWGGQNVAWYTPQSRFSEITKDTHKAPVCIVYDVKIASSLSHYTTQSTYSVDKQFVGA